MGIAQIVKAGMNDDGNSLKVLKKVLTDNGFKHTNTAANVMLKQMEDKGLDSETSAYFQTVAISL